MADVAFAADISTAHLGEIETGKSFCSLPVLLRLSRALDYPMSEILPRLGGHRVRADAIDAEASGERTLSHPELDLVVSEVGVSAGDECMVELGGNDAHVRVLHGSCELDIPGQRASLGEGDVADLSLAQAVNVRATTDVTLLVVLGAEHRRS